MTASVGRPEEAAEWARPPLNIAPLDTLVTCRNKLITTWIKENVTTRVVCAVEIPMNTITNRAL